MGRDGTSPYHFRYKVDRDDNGNAQVYPKGGSGAPVETIQNLREGTDNVKVETPNKPERVETLHADKDASGKITNTKTGDAENLTPGIPIGSKNSANMDYKVNY